jgi:hypothetical protein
LPSYCDATATRRFGLVQHVFRHRRSTCAARRAVCWTSGGKQRKVGEMGEVVASEIHPFYYVSAPCTSQPGSERQTPCWD